MDKREFINSFADYSGETVVGADGKLSEQLAQKLHQEINQQLQKLSEGLDSGDVDDRDYSVYTGWAGIALLHLRLYEVVDKCQDPRHLKKALSYIEPHLRHLKRKRVTFLCGDAGPLAIGAVLYHKLGNTAKSQDCLDRCTCGNCAPMPTARERRCCQSFPVLRKPGMMGNFICILEHHNFTANCLTAGVMQVDHSRLLQNDGPQDDRWTRDQLKSRHVDVCEDDSLPDEFLFGRAGYLFSQLFVQHNFGKEAVDDKVIDKVFQRIIQSGEVMSRKQQSQCPLMYEWHDKKYLGAAHGLVGIFYVLMQLTTDKYKDTVSELVRPSIDFLMTLRFPSGNYPSSIGSASGDKLVHWCHGAPGWIHMFAAAYKTFKDPKYLEAAKSCAEVLWSRGLLKKGYGICHGVAGNGYGFLTLYNLTGEDKYLYRASKFAEWCCEYGKHNCRTPDRQYSLFEGLAGTIHFLVDMLDPKNAKFPAWEL